MLWKFTTINWENLNINRWHMYNFRMKLLSWSNSESWFQPPDKKTLCKAHSLVSKKIIEFQKKNQTNFINKKIFLNKTHTTPTIFPWKPSYFRDNHFTAQFWKFSFYITFFLRRNSNKIFTKLTEYLHFKMTNSSWHSIIVHFTHSLHAFLVYVVVRLNTRHSTQEPSHVEWLVSRFFKQKERSTHYRLYWTTIHKYKYISTWTYCSDVFIRNRSDHMKHI